MKFKVGDYVVATKDNPYGITNTKMKKAKVVKVSSLGMWIKILDHEIKHWVGCEYPVVPEYFKLASNEQIVIYRKDNEVIALDKTTGKKGVAKCSPEDEFDFNTGAKLAFERLVGGNEVKEVKQDKFKPGDTVILTKAYEDVPKGARGTFIERCVDDSCVIDFGVEYECTHDANCLKTSTGLWLYDTNFEKVSE